MRETKPKEGDQETISAKQFLEENFPGLKEEMMTEEATASAELAVNPKQDE